MTDVHVTTEHDVEWIAAYRLSENLDETLILFSNITFPDIKERT
jgi:hypothetical protein